MTKKYSSTSFPFPSSREEVKRVSPQRLGQYVLAFTDKDFLQRPELRPVRLQLELLKPELVLSDHKIEKTIVVFGSARMRSLEDAEDQLKELEKQLAKDPSNEQFKKQVVRARNKVANCHYLKEATKFARLVSSEQKGNLVIVTGGGPGFMEAANKGAHEANAPSIGLGVMLPNEQTPNPYITPELTFQFHYFAIRKMHFLMRAQALVAFPGGFGTLDELFETLTLLQTKKIERIPLLLFGIEYWKNLINFDWLVDQCMIDEKDLELIQFVETADEAWKIIKDFYKL
ncbi:MAG: LOG family protein [Proteobacteria bacterium]|nr:LOG family protein [Pseudomonadota bacterium]